MPRHRATLFGAILFVVAVSTASGQSRSAAGLGGRLSDESGAALPGVTVSIACAGSPALVVAVTDGAGRFAAPDVPAGSCTVTFELAGFRTVVRERIDLQAGQAAVVDQQLGLAAIEETVNVVAAAPDSPPAPAPRPHIQPSTIPAHETASVCGPGPLPFANRLIRLVGNGESRARTLYTPGDTIMVDAGWADGLAVGQNFVVRRPYRSNDLSWDARADAAGVHSAGLVQVVDITEASAVVAVVYACDEFMRGDDLDVFVPESYKPPRSDGPPDYHRPARVLLGDQGRMLGAPGRMMVIDQGKDAGVEVGQRVTLFRRASSGGAAVTTVGEAVVVAARADWSRIRIDSVRDVVYAGDLAAPHRRVEYSGKPVASAR
jgi:hypothetical protein